MSTFWRGSTPPLSKMKFPPYRQYRRLSTQETLFSDSPERFVFFLGLWGAFLAHLTTRNTSFSLCVCPKMRFFPKDSTYRAFFVFFKKKNYFLMVRKDLNAFLTFVHAAETANSRFWAYSSPQKVWHFLVSRNSIKIAPNEFFLVPQRKLRLLFAGAVASK